jgi:hypothetical protein
VGSGGGVHSTSKCPPVLKFDLQVWATNLSQPRRTSEGGTIGAADTEEVP